MPRWGSGEWIVIEADESDRSLLKLTPEIAVLTNAELDHHSTYASLADLERHLPHVHGAGGRPRRRLEPPRAQGAVPLRGHPVRRAGPDPDPGGCSLSLGRARGLTCGARRSQRGQRRRRADRRALAGCRPGEGGCRDRGLQTAPAGGSSCSGHTAAGVPVYDDYAHHPTEVAAAIAAARTLAPRRLVAVFQPHLYSRTRALGREFGIALAQADVAAVLGIYPARERAEDFPGIDGRLIANAAAEAGSGRTVAWLPGFDAARRFLGTRSCGPAICA